MQIGVEKVQPGELSVDYVVVGSGSAGAVVAERLSADPGTTVALLEAGPPDKNKFAHIPAGFAAVIRRAFPARIE